jgi:hypothetical protein
MDENDLITLGAPCILRQAVRGGLITALECAMPICLCPAGRSHFDATTGRRGPWIPTPDRWPVAGRDGGEYVPSNVRLAHARCNYAEGNRVGVERAHASGWYGSERQRELSRRNMKIMREGWGKTEAAVAARHRIGVAGGHARPREAAVRAGMAALPGLRAWEQTPEGHAHHRAVGRRLADWAATPEGQEKRLAALRARKWTPEARAAVSERMSRAGTISGCKRWNVDRGKPCTCGVHGINSVSALT